MKKKIKLNLIGFGKETSREIELKTREPFAPSQKTIESKKKYKRKEKHKKCHIV